jgi:phage FluMu protein Com
MQTVNFNCPHCGNLMAVGSNLLGKNVRCPHCKQVVRAPMRAGEAPLQTPPPPPLPSEPAKPQAAPMFNIQQPTEHHESIFGERHDEDVFGSEPLKPILPPTSMPTLEVPQAPELTPPPPVSARPPAEPPPPPMYEPLAFDAPTVTATAMPAVPSRDPLEEQPYDRPAPLERDREERRESGYRVQRPPREEAPGTPAFAWILLIYSIIITAAAGFFAYQYFTSDSKGDHPFKAMPDVIRQYDPAKKPQTAFQNMPDPKQEVPADLRVKLGEEIAVGDIKVQPVSVEKQLPLAVTKYKAAGDDRVRRLGDKPTLVLKLHVTNLSKDTVFDPNDPAFVRAFDANQPAPYTALEINQRLFYGTFRWPSDSDVEKEFFQSQDEGEKPLKPGEERDTYVTVAPPGSKTTVATGDFQKDFNSLKPTDWLLWRVQLRRGMADFKDGDKTVSLSATTVIGVQFQQGQIK